MLTSNDLKSQVRSKYNALAKNKQDCCATEDCSFVGEEYSSLDGYVKDADLGLGCGLPTQFAGIQPGNTVIDLGSGAGNDAFVARNIAGESGRVIGIDMAENMIQRANSNLARLNYQNVEFRLGDIEDIPLANDIADVVVSNCVMNLVPDKHRAYAETYRILKPGGHFCISDIVVSSELPAQLREAAELYVGCVGGATDRGTYLDTIRRSGFMDVTVRKERQIELSDEILDQYLTQEQKFSFRESGIGIYSITVTGSKPDESCCGSGCCN